MIKTLFTQVASKIKIGKASIVGHGYSHITCQRDSAGLLEGTGLEAFPLVTRLFCQISGHS